MEILNQIKKLLFADMATPPASATPAQYKTKDGVVITIDKLAVGGIATQDGTPLADGNYTLEDGTVITVVQGLISEVESAAQSATEPVDEMKKQVAAMQSELEELKKERDDIKGKFTAQTKANKLIVEMLEKFAEQTIDKPVDEVKKWDDMTPLEKFRASKTN